MAGSEWTGCELARVVKRAKAISAFDLDEIWTELLAGIGEPVRCKRPAFRRS